MLEPADANADIRAAREVLDRFGVANRLQHVRQYVWRGGTLRFLVHARPQHLPEVCYELEARWDAPVLQSLQSPANGQLQPYARPVVEGQWTRGTAGYVLRVGIDLAVPSAISIKASSRVESFVPFVGRPHDQVEQTLEADLSGYVNAFLTTCRPVPEAVRAGADQLRRILSVR